MADSRPAYSSAAPGTLQFPALQSQLTVSNIKMLWPVFQPLFLSYYGSLGAYQFQGGVLATWLSPETFLARIGVAAADVIPADPGPSAAAPDLAVWKTERLPSSPNMLKPLVEFCPRTFIPLLPWVSAMLSSVCRASHRDSSMHTLCRSMETSTQPLSRRSMWS